MTTLLEQLPRSPPWDRGKELSQRAAFKVETSIPVNSPTPRAWQRGTNENTNGLLRPFPKGTDLSRWTAEEIAAVPPPSTAGPLRLANPGRGPDKHLRSLREDSVATAD
jgi:IS30 family transposase